MEKTNSNHVYGEKKCLEQSLTPGKCSTNYFLPQSLVNSACSSSRKPSSILLMLYAWTLGQLFQKSKAFFFFSVDLRVFLKLLGYLGLYYSNGRVLRHIYFQIWLCIHGRHIHCSLQWWPRGQVRISFSYKNQVRKCSLFQENHIT